MRMGQPTGTAEYTSRISSFESATHPCVQSPSKGRLTPFGWPWTKMFDPAERPARRAAATSLIVG